MAILRLVSASGSLVEVKGDSALVGREPGCDVVVSDGSVSRKHARLEKRAAGWTVVDQGSANGTFLNSQRVAEAVIKSGQEIRFGAITFRAEVESDDDLAATVVATSSPDATVVAPADMLPATPRLGPTGGQVKAPESPPPSPVTAPPPVPKAGPPPLARPPAHAPAPPRARPAAGPPTTAPARERVSAPVGQMPAPPVSAKTGKGPIFWILTGCCGCLLLGVMLFAGIFGAAYLGTRAPATVVQTQLAELGRGDLDAAYHRLASPLQAQLSREDFERLVREHPGLRENMDATFWSRSVGNDKASLSGLLTSKSGEREKATFELVKEGGEWRVSSIRVGDTGTE